MRLLLYLLPVTLLAQPKPHFRAEVVDNQISIGYGLAIGDVDGDRLPDILLADQREFVWYKNPGGKPGSDGQPAKPWTRHVMARNLTPQDNVCIAARDLDGDGKVEVAVGAGWNPAETVDSTKSGGVFYLLRPADPTALWEPIRLPHEVTTHRMRWVRTGRTSYQLVVVPLHGAGNRNGQGRGVRVWGYALPKDPRTRWTQHLVDSTMHLTHNLDVWETGTRTQLVLAGKEGGKPIEWAGGRWRPAGLRVGADMGELRRGSPGNMGLPFFAAIQPMHGSHLLVYKNNETGRDTLSTRLNQGHALVCADWLGQGRAQIAAGWRNPNAEGKVGVRLFSQAESGQWSEHPLDERVRMACEDLQTADLDNDGDLDLIASGRATLNLLIYWNERIR